MIKTDIDTFGCLLATGKTREKKTKHIINFVVACQSSNHLIGLLC